jgi:hypothetical protein
MKNLTYASLLIGMAIILIFKFNEDISAFAILWCFIMLRIDIDNLNEKENERGK